jgi:hypothetical protein
MPEMKMMGREAPHPDELVDEVDDEVSISSTGFLTTEGQPYPSLPTHLTVTHLTALEKWAARCKISPGRAPMMVVGIMAQIKDNYIRARLILYETARLHKSSFAVVRRNRLKLSGNALLLDKKLCDAYRDQCLKGNIGKKALRNESEAINSLIMDDQCFKDMLGQ